ncbi:MAG: hypothetical protein GWN18_16805, partial [Thermoplasmata archaeon]|nr:hypothetical protein [Thermoplasmata archaeon]NIS13765.1 hypothetical protein [Thermoplasmata archaeon]NIT79198.1 hypothetical protein [Thermoplasmata archaeon]NIU50649.1 hypothetical protein [Thermoplasmata archaeon]NIV80371.1 hypothetical protein [Thermoplasmata archaeon]
MHWEIVERRRGRPDNPQARRPHQEPP